MPQLPAAYLRDAVKFREISAKLIKAGRRNGNMVPAARDLATQLRAFLARWQHQPAVAAHQDVLAQFRSQLLSTERHIEALHVATLAELLEFRKCRIYADLVLQCIHELSALIQNANPDELIELRSHLAKSGHGDFEPAAALAAQTAEIARQDADCARLIDEYERLWPDRLDDRHYLAILDLELDQHESLVEELHLMKCSLA